MNKLLLAVVMLLLSPIIYAAECPTLNTDLRADLSWIAPDLREDNTKLLDSEIKRYQLYLTNRTTGVQCTVDVGKALAYSFNINEADIYDASMTTFDTDGRESNQSIPIVLNADYNKPAMADVSVTNIAGTSDYLINWPLVTTYENGELLAEPPIKYYLFINGKWLQGSDVYAHHLPATRTLAVGDTIQVETEIKTGGVHVTSDRSPLITVAAPAIVKKKAHPPHSQKYKVNKGYKKVP